MIRVYGPDILKWIAIDGLKLDETDTYDRIHEIIDDTGDWLRAIPAWGIAIGGVAVVGIGRTAPAVLSKINDRLDQDGLPPMETVKAVGCAKLA